MHHDYIFESELIFNILKLERYFGNHDMLISIKIVIKNFLNNILNMKLYLQDVK
jgi:hypothetical protein